MIREEKKPLKQWLKISIPFALDRHSRHANMIACPSAHVEHDVDVVFDRPPAFHMCRTLCTGLTSVLSAEVNCQHAEDGLELAILVKIKHTRDKKD